jgi:bacillithiol system protein YtxJ
MNWFSIKSNFPWLKMNYSSSVKQIMEESIELPQIIFKHSTRCSISSMALNRFEREWDKNIGAKLYYLDLIEFRSLSNEIAELLTVEHQSPQVILLMNREVKYSASHNGIEVHKILDLIKNS